MESCHYSFLLKSKLVECNTWEINKFNHKLTDTLNGINYSSTNVFNNHLTTEQIGSSLPAIPNESVKCAKIVYKNGTGVVFVARGCVYYKAKFCKPSEIIKSCKTCVFDGCNDSTSLLKSSGVPTTIITAKSLTNDVVAFSN
ncbi:Hypothetical protein CINCED_3A019174 [Cinara cedri]|uniref:Uncharacterized protein n=1 Tax=Cinara cedri TaxID=506608 RepID=A0A5E4M2A9_9HEMI|nr:Hypothetical protein CINCED_3A019174 [Cinara cedri]